MIVVAGIAGIAVAISLSPASGPAPTADSVARLTTYEAAITPTLQSAGAMVEQEIKPSIASLEDGSLSAAGMRSRAVSWRTRFDQARAALARVAVPAGLTKAAADFDRAFQQYEAAVALLATVPNSATGTPNPAQVQAAATAAHQADVLYDQAAAVIQALRRVAGLGPTVDLPDPTPSAVG